MPLEEVMDMAKRYEMRPRRRAFAWFTWTECGFQMEESVWTSRRLEQLVSRCNGKGFPFEIYLDVSGGPSYASEGVMACTDLETA